MFHYTRNPLSQYWTPCCLCCLARPHYVGMRRATVIEDDISLCHHHAVDKVHNRRNAPMVAVDVCSSKSPASDREGDRLCLYHVQLDAESPLILADGFYRHRYVRQRVGRTGVPRTRIVTVQRVDTGHV